MQHFGVLGGSKGNQGHRTIAAEHARESVSVGLLPSRIKDTQQLESNRMQRNHKDKAPDMVGELQVATTYCYMASFLSSASSWLTRSQVLGNYAIQESPSSFSSSSQRKSSQAQSSSGTAVKIGLWTVSPAKHRSSGKAASVWSYEKSSAPSSSSSRRGASAVEGAIVEALKAEVSKLTRMRMPCVLEVVEPLEETRSGLIWASEPVTCSLRAALAASSTSSRERLDAYHLELDEVEVSTIPSLINIYWGSMLTVHVWCSSRKVCCRSPRLCTSCTTLPEPYMAISLLMQSSSPPRATGNSQPCTSRGPSAQLKTPTSPLTWSTLVYPNTSSLISTTRRPSLSWTEKLWLLLPTCGHLDASAMLSWPKAPGRRSRTKPVGASTSQISTD